MKRDGCCPCLQENNNAIVTKYRPISISVPKYLLDYAKLKIKAYGQKQIFGKRTTRRLERNTANLRNTWVMTDVQTLLFNTSQSNSDTQINMKMELKEEGLLCCCSIVHVRNLLPSSGRCLQGQYLETGLYATVPSIVTLILYCFTFINKVLLNIDYV
jgi:hypothetical protein